MVEQDRIKAFINSLDRGNEPYLDELEIIAKQQDVPIIRKDTQALLKFLMVQSKPLNILEVGAATGFSALLMAEYSSPETKITTIEKYEKRIPVARENFIKYDRDNKITLLEGDATEILKALQPGYDFIFMDAAKGQYINFLPDCLRILNKGGLYYLIKTKMSKRLDPSRAQLNSTIMIQDIVAILKNPPFNETMTLFSFEEKKEYELLDLIVKVMGMIDTSMKLDNNDTAACLKAVFEFLQILKFPYSSERQLQDDLAKGDKRLLIQILHFLLTGLRTLSDKYYLNKFTAPINISQEYLGDDDILELWNQFKELQAEFTSTYKMLEEKKINAPKIDEIQDDIRKCQNDKLQLSRSIAKHKKDYANKPDFQELFQMTSKLRKEQEQDSNLEKKLAKQQYDIKEAEERLIVAQQRLLDNKKNLDNNISALKLLENARAQRNNNRDAFENLGKYELIDRRNRIKTLEEILQMPEITINDIQDLKAQRQELISDIEKLELKLKNSPTNSSELQIYKQSAMQATKAREDSEKNLAKLEKEKNLLEIKYNELNKKFEATKGYKFVRKKWALLTWLK